MWLRIITMVLGALAAPGTPNARIQTQMYCWISDVEFPVACAEDEDGDYDDDEDGAEYEAGPSSDA